MLPPLARTLLIVAALALAPAVALGQQSPTPKGVSKGSSGTTAPTADSIDTGAGLKKTNTNEDKPARSSVGDEKNTKRR
jgi:hypothetical protein